MSDARDIPIDFSSFVVSLASSAMLHLGETKNPETGKAQANLPLARNTIDLLGLLETKTEGNLDEDELALLQTVLKDLREHLAARTA